MRRESSDNISNDIILQVLIGDTIVWWRAWVLWKNNRMVCFLYLALTFAAFGEVSFLLIPSLHLIDHHGPPERLEYLSLRVRGHRKNVCLS